MKREDENILHEQFPIKFNKWEQSKHTEEPENSHYTHAKEPSKLYKERQDSSIESIIE